MLLYWNILNGWPGMGGTPKSRMGLSFPNHMDWDGSPKEVDGWGIVMKKRGELMLGT